MRIHQLTRRGRALAGRFLGSTSGNTAMIFGLVSVIVIMAGGAGVDVARAVSMKTRLSSALDAAALAVGTQLDLDEDELEAMAQKYFDANYPDSALGETEDVQLVQTGEKISLSVDGQVETTLLKIININYFDLHVANEVTRSANNIEVGLVLDITQSMCLPDCTKINNLKVAAKDMVDMIVQDVQTPYYTKMALIPYSSSVNVGSYAASVRGTITAGKTVTNAVWMTGSNINVSGATKANPAVITTSAAHGLVAGDKIWISGVSGMTQLNNKPYIVGTVPSTTTFQLKDVNNVNVNSSGYSTYSSSASDIIRKCVETACNIRVTSAGHGFTDGQYVVVKDIVGMTQLNAGSNKAWLVSGATSDDFLAVGAMDPGTTASSTYTSGGTAYCTTTGCQWHRFSNEDGDIRVFEISTCVSERIETGLDAFKDVAPSTTPLGRVYPAYPEPPATDANPCVTPTITPLSTDKVDLKTKIDALATSGSTAGHLGAAWGWYMISPNFKYLWPDASKPADYGTDHLFKIVVLMTDGEFNTFYCNNVISQDAAHISGYTHEDDHKNCDGNNGTAFYQAQQLCAKMKAEDIIVYTVGFDIGDDENAQEIIAQCATDSEHAYYPETGAELKTSFQHIAQEISQLRLSQ